MIIPKIKSHGLEKSQNRSSFALFTYFFLFPRLASAPWLWLKIADLNSKEVWGSDDESKIVLENSRKWDKQGTLPWFHFIHVLTLSIFQTPVHILSKNISFKSRRLRRKLWKTQKQRWIDCDRKFRISSPTELDFILFKKSLSSKYKYIFGLWKRSD